MYNERDGIKKMPSKTQKRTLEFYRANEVKVLKSLNLKPQPNSGSGQTHKEDGKNDELLVQLKSTDKASIKLEQDVWNVLQYNSTVAHKTPMLVLQFLQHSTSTDDVFIVCKYKDLPIVANSLYPNGFEVTKQTDTLDVVQQHSLSTQVVQSSSQQARSQIRTYRDFKAKPKVNKYDDKNKPI